MFGCSICGEDTWWAYECCCCCCCQCPGCETGVGISGTECALLAVPVDDLRAWLSICTRSLGEGAPIPAVSAFNSIFVFLSNNGPVLAWTKQVGGVTATARRPKRMCERCMRNASWSNLSEKHRLHANGCGPKQSKEKEETPPRWEVEQLICASRAKEMRHIPALCSGTPRVDTECPKRARRTAFSCSSSSFLRMRSIVLDDELLSSWVVRSRTWRSRPSIWSLVL
jgi:hypothetical protein